jgi:hypothetical protein
MEREWTDEQLSAAVQRNHSWRGVARALRLKATSAGTIRGLKRRAATLALDASHFTQQRTWSDVDLKQAIARSSTWEEVLRTLGLSGGHARLRLKGHAARLGLDVTGLDEKHGNQRDMSRAIAARPDPAHLRDAAESFAAAWFAVRGYAVAVPAQRSSYDLLVTFPDRVRRIQVKTTTFRGNHGTWTVSIGQRPYTLDKSAGRTAYDPDSIDEFFVIDGDNAVYLIPSVVVGGRLAINVGAYRDYRVGDASSLFVDLKGKPAELAGS